MVYKFSLKGYESRRSTRKNAISSSFAHFLKKGIYTWVNFDRFFAPSNLHVEKTNVSYDWVVSKKNVSKLGLNESSRILDIGSKDGGKAHYLIDNGQLVLSDISKRKQTSPFVISDATHLPFNDDTFDLVTMLHVIEHVENDKMALQEIYRVLKNNGSAIVVTPNSKRLTKLYSIILKIFTKSPYKYPLNPDHVFEYSSSDIERLMTDSKFENYNIKPIFMRTSRVIRIRKYCDQWIVIAEK